MSTIFLTCQFWSGFGYRISPLIFINLNLDREDIVAKIKELNNSERI